MGKVKYTLELTDKQADILIKALDLYSRLGRGQIEALHEYLMHFTQKKQNIYDIVKSAMYTYKLILTDYMPSVSNSLSHDDLPDAFKVAHDIATAIRNIRLVDRHDGGIVADCFKFHLKETGSEKYPTIKRKK